MDRYKQSHKKWVGSGAGDYYLSYYNCMSQTKSETITQKGADHVAAQCKAFILERIMVK